MSGFAFHTDPQVVDLTPAGDRRFPSVAVVGLATRDDTPDVVVAALGPLELTLTPLDAVALGMALISAGQNDDDIPDDDDPNVPLWTGEYDVDDLLDVGIRVSPWAIEDGLLREYKVQHQGRTRYFPRFTDKGIGRLSEELKP